MNMLLSKKLLRPNHVPHIIKELRKTIMKRSELKSKNLKVETQE